MLRFLPKFYYICRTIQLVMVRALVILLSLLLSSCRYLYLLLALIFYNYEY